MEDNEEKINKEKSDTKKPDTENQTIKKTDIKRDLTADLPKKKSLGLDDVEEITRNMNRLRNLPNIDRDVGLGRMTEISRMAQQLTNMKSLPKTIGLGDMYRGLDPSVFSKLTEMYVDNGFALNDKVVKTAVFEDFYRSVTSVGLRNQIKALNDTMASFRDMASSLNVLKNSAIPHMSFYRGILDTIDEGTYNRMTEELVDEEIEDVEEDGVAEDATVIRPECLNVALTINMYVTVTENHVQSSPGVSDEEKKAWVKVAKPILIRIIGLFLSWAFGYSMDGMMEHFEPFEKIAEISEEYHYPVETTEVEDVDVDVKHES